MKKTQITLKIAYGLLGLLLIGCIFLSGCSEKKVVHPLDVVKQEEETAEEEAKKADDTDESASEEEEIEPEKVEEEPQAKEPEEIANSSLPKDKEDFLILDPDDSETETDAKEVVMIDGKPAIDLVFFLGQSNMSGAGGDASKAPIVEEGHGYEFRAVSDPTMLYKIEEPFGKNESFIGAICDLPGAKKGSMVSCFANEYYSLTGVPIVGVSASQGASTTELWLTPAYQFDLQQRYDRAVDWLEDSGYYIRNRYAVWFQGESDAANHVQPEIYNTNMDNIIRPLFISGLSKVFIVTPGRTLSIRNYFDDIVHQQLTMCKESGYYALGTNILSDISTEYMVDEWHYNQLVLNRIGIETAKSVAYYTNNRQERLDYNYEDDCTYIPDGFDYSEDEVVEPLDLSDLQKLQDEYWEEYIDRDRKKE